MNKEGFWWSVREPNLPFPESKPRWSKKKKFLDALSVLEAKATRNLYRGISRCRLCGEANGNAEFTNKNWTWPQGYRHYIDDHDVRPSREFRQYVFEINPTR